MPVALEAVMPKKYHLSSGVRGTPFSGGKSGRPSSGLISKHKASPAAERAGFSAL
jgi:hypothetical protein